ncbi:hypothetical protein C2845_PM07G22850 [Panicum miliaceum]|uniref:Uncharacterized protein n=1 Tax=Panicum miliaceum TaxID=4540 RepID=A0A3L6SQ23_PANMI|nr:hypothetical protein C2845_PM07G22850 [Panicum miliaceum]
MPATATAMIRRNRARPAKATTRPQQHEAAARSSPRGPASGRSGGRASCPSKDAFLTGWYTTATPPLTLSRFSGTYLRNGPGLWDVGGGGAFHHLFDGYATLVRVSFRRGRATGAHRPVESDAPGSLLDRVSNDAVGIASGAALTDNPNSAVLPLGEGRVLCLTETTKSSVLVDPETLATAGKLRYADGLGGMMMMIQSAHPIVTESELLTVLPDLARPGHLVVRMAAGSDEREVIGWPTPGGCTRSPSRRTTSSCRGGPTPGWIFNDLGHYEYFSPFFDTAITLLFTESI